MTGSLSQSVRLGNKRLETHDQNFYFPTEHCGYSPYVTSSLTRGLACHLQLLLGLASVVILRSKSRGMCVNFVASVWFSHKPIRYCGNVLSEPLSSNELFWLSGIMSQYMWFMYII
jgi:hypothetical protein